MAPCRLGIMRYVAWYHKQEGNYGEGRVVESLRAGRAGSATSTGRRFREDGSIRWWLALALLMCFLQSGIGRTRSILSILGCLEIGFFELYQCLGECGDMKDVILTRDWTGCVSTNA